MVYRYKDIIQRWERDLLTHDYGTPKYMEKLERFRKLMEWAYHADDKRAREKFKFK